MTRPLAKPATASRARALHGGLSAESPAARLSPEQLPARWRSSAPAIKAVQVAFDVSESVMETVRCAAYANNLSTSDQLRQILGLTVVRQAKRPRLTLSLSAEDYQVLGKRFRKKTNDHLGIKEQVFAALIEFAQAASEPSKLRERSNPPKAAPQLKRPQSKNPQSKNPQAKRSPTHE